jgi:hypothetical protein
MSKTTEMEVPTITMIHSRLIVIMIQKKRLSYQNKLNPRLMEESQLLS